MEDFQHQPNVAYFVSRGAMFLDRVAQRRWWEDIDLDTFKIESFRDCILAQVFNTTYSGALHMLDQLGHELDQPSSYGFTTPYGITDSMLNAEWVRVIRDRSEVAPEPRAPWERELLDLNGSTVTFTLTNGKTVSFDNVNVDSVGPSAESPGVIGVEFANDADRVVHVPFVSHWEFTH